MLLFLQRSREPQFTLQFSQQLHSHVHRKEDSSTVFKSGKSHRRSLLGHRWNENKRWDKSVKHPVQPLSFLLLPTWSPQDCQKMWMSKRHTKDHAYILSHYLHTYTHSYISFIHRTISGMQHAQIQHTCPTYLLLHMPFINIKTKRHHCRALTPQTVSGTYIHLYTDTYVNTWGIHNHSDTSCSHIQIMSFMCPLSVTPSVPSSVLRYSNLHLLNITSSENDSISLSPFPTPHSERKNTHTTESESELGSVTYTHNH